MVKSLAWRIQIWHALTMAIVVAVLSVTLYLRIERAEFDRIDTELEGGAQLMVASLRALSDEAFERGEFTVPQVLGDRLHLPPAGRPRPPRDRPPPPHKRRPRRDEDRPAYIIWRRDGSVLKQSEGAPDIALADAPRLEDDDTSHIRPRRGHREVYLRGPHGSVVLISRPVHRELGDLIQWRLFMLAAGICALLVGSLGGAWLTRRALRPIADMTNTAATISGEDLSQRIDTRAIDIELAGLATTLNDAFDRLEADIQKKTRFAADASHELRTPLTIILGYLEFALSQPTTTVATRETLEACLRAARRMKSLIEQLLLLARADAGKLAPDRVTFDLGAVVEECVDLLAPLAKEKQVALQTALKPLELQGDPALLSQVVINLVTNAIQHNRQGGSVRITLMHSHDQLFLAVTDTGPGIEAAALPHIFERFYRADAARSRQSGGAGLGLAISQSIVRAHGGELTVASVEGEGTTFTVVLPG